MQNMPLTLQDNGTSFYLDLWFFCNYVGWSKLVFINTILCKPTLNNDYMNMNMNEWINELMKMMNFQLSESLNAKFSSEKLAMD